jgi:hypothetical protein
MKAPVTVVVVAAFQLIALAQTPNLSPIPAEWLRDGRLVVPSLNFSLGSPSSDATWSYQKLSLRNQNGTLFLSTISEQERYVMIVTDAGGRLDRNDTKEFIKGMQRTLPKDWTIEDVEMEPAVIPTADSTKFRIKFSIPDRSIVYTHGYLLPGKRTYMFMVYVREAEEPSNLSNFVSSFRLLSPGDNAPPPSPPRDGGIQGVLLIFSIGGAIADSKYKKNGGRRSGGAAELCLWLGCLGCIGLLIYLGVRGTNAEALGEFSVMLSVFLFAFWELGRWYVRWRFPVRAADQITE